MNYQIIFLSFTQTLSEECEVVDKICEKTMLSRFEALTYKGDDRQHCQLVVETWLPANYCGLNVAQDLPHQCSK